MNAVSEPICMLAAVDPVPAEPQHGDAGEVHHQHHDREHRRQPAAGADGDVGELVVGVPEPVGLERLAHERADHPDAGDLLAQHPVDRVDPLLDQAEVRDHPGDDDADRDEQRRHDDGQQPGEPEVLAHRHQDAADHHDRDGRAHRGGHLHQHLHLLHVVGAAGDQRRRAEVRHLPPGERPDALEEVGAQVAPGGHRRTRPEPDGHDRAGDLDDARPAASRRRCGRCSRCRPWPRRCR